jgi:2',3'-cyclic-nucleotide 2'-phosphodiesterase (5'-nucleotidase family)
MDEASGKPLFQRYLIRKVNGLRMGIFSLLSLETFLTPSDPRKKGITVRDPVETARDIVEEIRSKADFIILLSHLGYPRDVELAQKISGIHIIAGGHTNVDLTNPPVINNTIIVQNSSKGMYGRKVNFTWFSKDAPFYNMKRRHTLEYNLSKLRQQLTSAQASEAERNQWKGAVENIEQALRELAQKNPFTVTSLSLGDSVKDHPEIKKMVEAYKSKFPEKTEPPVHDSRGTYRSKR